MNPIIISIAGEPVPFARAGANGSRRFTPPKQAAFMSVVRDSAARAMDGAEPLEGPLQVQIRATYLRPASWSKKRCNSTDWKSSKPDVDNLAKLLKDALNTVVYRDDAQVSCLTVQKKYGSVASVIITVDTLENGRGA